MTDDALIVHDAQGAVRFAVHVTPRASRDAILGVRDGVLRVSLTAPPVDGAANLALVELIAETLSVPKRAVEVLHGERGRRKVVRVDSVSAEALRAALRA